MFLFPHPPSLKTYANTTLMCDSVRKAVAWHILDITNL